MKQMNLNINYIKNKKNKNKKLCDLKKKTNTLNDMVRDNY